MPQVQRPDEKELVEVKPPEQFSFKAVGDTVEGRLVDVRAAHITVDGEGRNVMEFVVARDEEGLDLVTFLATSYLQDAIRPAMRGRYLFVSYTGDKPTPNGAMKVFKVVVGPGRAVAAPAAGRSLGITDADLPF